jgi:broad-specificity NMP kinase
MEKLYNIYYKENKIHTNLTAEDCSEILQDFSERFYSGEDIDLETLKLEEIYG